MKESIIELRPKEGLTLVLVEEPEWLPKKGQYKYSNPPYKYRIWFNKLQAVPLDVEDFDPSPYELYEIKKLPKGEYKFIGTWPGLTEEECAELVEEHNGLFEYPDYERSRLCLLKSATESFQSLLTSKAIEYKRMAVIQKL